MRVARVQISKEFFEQFIKADVNQPPGRTLTTDAPKDLEVLGFATSKQHPFTFEALVKSEVFVDVAEGAEPPIIKPFTYTVHYEAAD